MRPAIRGPPPGHDADVVQPQAKTVAAHVSAAVHSGGVITDAAGLIVGGITRMTLDASIASMKAGKSPISVEPRVVTPELVALENYVSGVYNLPGVPPFDGDCNILRKSMGYFAKFSPVRLGKPELDGMGKPAADITAATGIEAWWYTWPGVPADAPVIIHAHSGARVAGSSSPDGCGESVFFLSRLTRVAHSRVLAVDFPLAPEANGAMQVDAMVKVYAQVRAAGVDAAKIALVGEVGGASLAAATALAIKDRFPADRIAGTWLISPMASSEVLPSWDGNYGKDLLLSWGSKVISRIYDYICNKDGPNPIPRDDPSVSPVKGNWAGAAPLYISTSPQECLYDDAILLAKVARAAGVDVTVSSVPNMLHDSVMWAEFVPESNEELGAAGRWLRRRFGLFADSD